MGKLVDIVIPLGCGSTHDNWELRMALRSIERFAGNCGSVYIVCDTPPSWVQKVKILYCPDTHKHNKDANIIDKLSAAARLPELSEKFIFWSDDQIALRRFDAGHLPPVYNRRGYQDFSGKRIWHRRMRNTLDYLQRQKITVYWNWDAHTPQPMNKKKLLELFAQIDYHTVPGYCVNTLYFGLQRTPAQIVQENLKATVEKAAKLAVLPLDKLFLGYNDAAWQGNLPDLLEKFLPDRSRYEK